jgi:biopolymer transport protein ExbB
MRYLAGMLIVLILAWTCAPAGLRAATAEGAAEGAAIPAAEPSPATIGDVGPQHIFSLLRRGDPTMWALLACSVLTITFALERLVVLRRSRVIPRTFVERFMERLREGELDRGKALELCRDSGSPIANVFAVVVQNWGQKASEIRGAVNDGAQSELFYLRRGIRALSGIATLAPLLGLFGTVIGMIRAFHALSEKVGAGKTELLAQGISLALVATATGLAVAIVAASSYYFLLGRVDALVQEMDLLANDLVGHVAAEGRPSSEKAPHARPRVVPQVNG